MVDALQSENSPVSVILGATTYENVVLVATKFQAVKGGDIVTARTTGNSHVPQGTTDHPKEAVVIVTLDSVDTIPNLITANYLNMGGANVALSAFVITEKKNTGTTRTIAFTAANSKVQQVSSRNEVIGAQAVEIQILTYGTVTYSSWA